jgi:hypothetical protein
MNLGPLLVGVFVTILGLVGLVAASRAVDDGIYIFGLILFVFAVLLDFLFIKRHFDRPT